MTPTAIANNIKNPDKAEVWLDRDNPHRTKTGGLPNLQDMVDNQLYKTRSLIEDYRRENRYLNESNALLLESLTSHQQQSMKKLQQHTQTLQADASNISSSWAKASTPVSLWQQWLSYSTNSVKRGLQTADVLQQRGDIFIEHERAGCPPVLDYDYDVIMDASTFERPCNYVLLKIKAPEGVTTDDDNRPYIIIDPRAGHGAGIGGFKPESQVGVALKSGRPVYFVAFKRLPEPTQTIADITYAEGIFVREVEKRHPNAAAPVIVGNCQGGWAALILAATHEDITGPIVMNGAPVAAWSGEIGVNPMRYKAGVNGGTWLAMMSADMTNGVFDGAWLVNNFEQMHPFRNYLGKYYDLYQNPIANRQRFLDFERWWGGFFLMNEAEIRWIVENIFIGNRIARNTGQLEQGVNIDLRNVKAPIIVFASRGDDITPPPQALAWILDAYTDEQEVEVCGQRIIYMIHEDVGHLGIFVSSKIANREHQSIASLMDLIEVLPPGLYEMDIENLEGQGQDKTFSVDLVRRTFEDLSQVIGKCRTDEKLFRAVHRSSKAQTRLYEQTLQPVIKALSNETTAQMLRAMHPLRLQRSFWNSKNPLAMASRSFNALVGQTGNTTGNTTGNAAAAQKDGTHRDDIIHTSSDTQSEANLQGQGSVDSDVHAHVSTNVSTNDSTNDSKGESASRQSRGQDYGYVKLPAVEPMAQDNLFLQVEKLFMHSMDISMEVWGDWQAMMTENLFLSIWSMPWLRDYGNKEGSRRLLDKNEVRHLPKVADVVAKVAEGGFVEAVIRMLIMGNIVADDNIDRNQLTRLTEVITQQQPFNSLSQAQMAAIIQDQTLIVRFAEAEAITALTTLLADKSKRADAYKLVLYVVGDEKDNLNLKTITMLDRIKDVLDLKNEDVE